MQPDWPSRADSSRSPRPLFTVGHSNHSFDHFAELLARHRIEAVSDVRSTPFSRRNPQFNQGALKTRLSAAGVSYVFLGRELGVRSTDPDHYVDGKVQYRALARERSFLDALERIRTGAETLRIALMCAERDPLDCHRTILVCRALRTADLDIQHILADGSLESGTAAERRLMAALNILPDMFHDEAECVERAYDTQADRIAYVWP
jgi:uncharacterized protein (DUF488 family)